MKERTMFAELDEAEPSIMRFLMFHFIKLPRTMIQFFWFQSKRLRTASCPVVERLASSLIMHGRNNGKEASLTMLGACCPRRTRGRTRTEASCQFFLLFFRFTAYSIVLGLSELKKRNQSGLQLHHVPAMQVPRQEAHHLRESRGRAGHAAEHREGLSRVSPIPFFISWKSFSRETLNLCRKRRARATSRSTTSSL